MLTTPLKLSQIISAGVDLDLKGAAIVVTVGDEVARSAFLQSISAPTTEKINDLVSRTISYLKQESKKTKLIPHVVGVETEAYNAVGNRTAQKSRLLGHFLVELYNNKFSICEVKPKSVKAFAGNGNATKEMMAELVKSVWRREFTKFGKFNNDVTDAFVVSQLVLNRFGHEFLGKVYKYLTEKQIKTIENMIEESKIYHKKVLEP